MGNQTIGSRTIRYVYETDKRKSDEAWRKVVDFLMQCAEREQEKIDQITSAIS